MKFWEYLTRRHSQKSATEKQLILSGAYRAVFFGNADRPQQQMVLADLQARCGFTQITHPLYASDRDLWFREGKRAAYGEIFAHLSLGPDDIEALNHAARVEAAQLTQDA